MQCDSCQGKGQVTIIHRYQERNPNIHDDYVTRNLGSDTRDCGKCGGRGVVSDDNGGNGDQSGGSSRLDGGRWYGG